MGVNYGPFHKDGQSPEFYTYIPPEQIRADLNLISGANFKFVKTYAVDNGLDQVVPLAAAHYPHLKICVGVYESSVNHEDPHAPHSTKAQLNQAIQLANSYPNVAAIVVGNECLYGDSQAGDHWVSVAQLMADLEYVRKNLTEARRAQVVLTTGLSWGAAHGNQDENGHPINDQLKTCGNIDVWMINIYPWYAGIACREADIYANLDWNYQEFNHIYGATGKPIIIGEIGWPSDGPPQGAAVASVDNEHHHTCWCSAWCAEKNWSAFLFEMFDEPWKSEPNGPYWGLYDKYGSPKWTQGLAHIYHLILGD
ncbi:MAG: glycosyl hydrolase family 17 protein [Desulfobacteraceae bacterium]